MIKSIRVSLLTLIGCLIVAFMAGYLIKEKELKEPVVKKEIGEQVLPECFLGRCPDYYSMDVDGDGLAESAVVIPTAMTQGAGKVWIIDNGKLVFDSGEKMRIGITQTKEQGEKGLGFTLWYGTEVNSTKWAKVKYLYQEDRFKPEEK